MSTDVISYGGGVQSTALLVLWLEGEVEAAAACHANVGDRAEHPLTVSYVREVAIPRVTEAGRTLAVTASHRGDLYDKLADPADPFQGIPIRMSQSGAPGYRTCTIDWKRVPLRKWRVANGYGEGRALLGISTDEIRRARTDPDVAYPLIDLGLSRADCEAIVARAGWPVPPKSACWFCPYTSVQGWRERRRDHPDLFAKAVELERTINAKRPADDPAWLSSRMGPLDQVIAVAQDTIDGWDEACDGGWCGI